MIASSPSYRHLTATRQRGAALVTGLLVLLLATFIAMASLDNATLQERMAANEANLNIAFQTAQAGVNDKLDTFDSGTISDLTQAINEYAKPTSNRTWPTSEYAGQDGATTVIETRNLGTLATSTRGQSMNADEGSPMLPIYLYEVHSTTRVDGSGARVHLVQGMEYH